MARQRELIDRNTYIAQLNIKSDREIIMDVALMQFDQCIMCEEHAKRLDDNERRIKDLEMKKTKKFATAGGVGAAIGTAVAAAIAAIINFYKGNAG